MYTEQSILAGHDYAPVHRFESRRRFQNLCAQKADAPVFAWHLALIVSDEQTQEPQDVCGYLDVWVVDLIQRRLRVGYALFPEYRNQGLMHEALERFVNSEIEAWKISSVEARCRADNKRSLQLLLKLGFVQTDEERNGVLQFRLDRRPN